MPPFANGMRAIGSPRIHDLLMHAHVRVGVMISMVVGPLVHGLDGRGQGPNAHEQLGKASSNGLGIQHNRVQVILGGPELCHSTVKNVEHRTNFRLLWRVRGAIRTGSIWPLPCYLAARTSNRNR